MADPFWVVSEDGERVRVRYAEGRRISTGSLDGPGSIPGLGRYVTIDGRPVNKRGAEFEIDGKVFKDEAQVRGERQ